MYKFFLVVHAIIAAAMVGVILLQRSEGGGLAGGGSPAGLMSARGAADFLTRMTTILATLFVALSIGLAALAIQQRAPTQIDTSLAKTAPLPAPLAPASGIPMAGAVAPTTAPAPQSVTTIAPQPAAPIVTEKVVAEKRVAKKAEVKPVESKPAVTKAATPPAAVKVAPPPVVVPAPTTTPTPSIPAGNPQ